LEEKEFEEAEVVVGAAEVEGGAEEGEGNGGIREPFPLL